MRLAKCRTREDHDVKLAFRERRFILRHNNVQSTRGWSQNLRQNARKLYKNYDCRFEIDIPLRLHIRLDVKSSSLEDEVV